MTVLFADVQGSMALAEQVDAEEWHAMMSRFFAILADGVHRFEGTVNQYTGDGMMALFGAPLAHEDHAQRACHAALHLTAALRDYAQALRRERGLQFSVRMGLNSGEVVVGAIGDDLRMDYTAQGHTVGLASRMEQLCEPGRAYLTEATAALVEGYFALEDLGLFTIKGVSANRCACSRCRPGPRCARASTSRARAVCRASSAASDELATARGGVAAPPAGRRGRSRSVAEAGVGKSRLCLEFADRCRARGAAVVETQALAHGAAVPYLPVLDLLRDLLGIDERDAPAGRAPEDRRRAAAARRCVQAESAAAVRFPRRPAISTARRRRPTEAAAFRACSPTPCVALLRARAGREPAVLVIEDLHWLDPASDAFVRDVVAGARRRAVLPCSTIARSTTTTGCAPPARTSGARAAAEADVGALLDELLGTDAVARRPLRRDSWRAPPAIRSSSKSWCSRPRAERRADRRERRASPRARDRRRRDPDLRAGDARGAHRPPAGGATRRCCRRAAVIGKEFAASVLRARERSRRAPLAARAGGVGRRPSSWSSERRSDGEYAFNHPLTQEVAYATQLRRSARPCTRAVARALVARAGDAASADAAALIAYHWETAGAVVGGGALASPRRPRAGRHRQREAMDRLRRSRWRCSRRRRRATR